MVDIDRLREDFEEQRRLCTGKLTSIEATAKEIKRFIGINGEKNQMSLAAQLLELRKHQQALMEGQTRLTVKLGIIWGLAAVVGAAIATGIVQVLF